VEKAEGIPRKVVLNEVKAIVIQYKKIEFIGMKFLPNDQSSSNSGVNIRYLNISSSYSGLKGLFTERYKPFSPTKWLFVE